MEKSEDDARDDARYEDDPKSMREGDHDPGEGRHRGAEEVDHPRAELHVDVTSSKAADDVADEEETCHPGAWR